MLCFIALLQCIRHLVAKYCCIGIRHSEKNNYPNCLSFEPSSALSQRLHITICAPWLALKTAQNPAHLGQLFFSEYLNNFSIRNRFIKTVKHIDFQIINFIFWKRIPLPPFTKGDLRCEINYLKNYSSKNYSLRKRKSFDCYRL